MTHQLRRRENLAVHPSGDPRSHATLAAVSGPVPDKGDTIHGYYLPRGTEVGHSMMRIGRQPRIWGPNATTFRPGRWLEVDPESLEEMATAVDLIFSSGNVSIEGTASQSPR